MKASTSNKKGATVKSTGKPCSQMQLGKNTAMRGMGKR